MIKKADDFHVDDDDDVRMVEKFLAHMLTSTK